MQAMPMNKQALWCLILNLGINIFASLQQYELR
jgi:hypothetical protein